MHRDVKPANLLINHRGQVKVSDFGVAREMDGGGAGGGTGGGGWAACCETFVGTYTYFSPERIAGLPYGYGADIWSLGLSVLTLALGQFPYERSARDQGYWGLLQVSGPPPPPPFCRRRRRRRTAQRRGKRGGRWRGGRRGAGKAVRRSRAAWTKATAAAAFLASPPAPPPLSLFCLLMPSLWGNATIHRSGD